MSYCEGIARIKLAHRGRRIELLLVARGGRGSIGRRVRSLEERVRSLEGRVRSLEGRVRSIGGGAWSNGGWGVEKD